MTDRQDVLAAAASDRPLQGADVGAARERTRRRRLWRIAAVLAPVLVVLWVKPARG
ncbi:hypothetical protein GCM10025868_13010 [Angustibacter aerolatus]|uniref:ABC transporter permease n=1 Tax=Angustibacter aerolatus TaxID=1162965 RepID=A0ABQ6JCY7_9ACTN|nr:hypothetical protein [Angustibacter aerolatus]GMA86051.1 hypothetical protein GCM10025868_13010 [Angustibacter aerolatus]